LTARVPAGGTIVGVVTTKEPAKPALNVTIDPNVCGATLPDESVTVDAAGHVANAVVTVTGVKQLRPLRSR
jgi:ribulose 1,5-bisphosphate synthetase/thiazole synthase